jgi:hypothetical protein
MRSLRDFDAAALKLRDMGSVVLDENTPDGEMRKVIFALIGHDVLSAAVDSVGVLAEPQDESYFTELRKFHRKIGYAPETGSFVGSEYRHE